VTVDALGSAATAIPGIMSLRSLGRHLRLGVSNHREQGSIAIPVDILVFQELSFLGSWGMQAARYPEMLERIESGMLNPDLMVKDTVTLDQASDVLTSMNEYETVGMSVITAF
jgi:propanol-preferring alcohol dehydrogenase